MIRKKSPIWDIILISAFLLTFVSFLLLANNIFHPVSYSLIKPANLQNDQYDSTLVKLNTMSKLEAYCDSMFSANQSTKTYPGIVADVMRKKFYHGYSYYDMSSNPLAVLFAPIVKNGAEAVVIPSDIVKYPMAACSQQSIVGMQLLRRKGYNVRKVAMWDSINKVGHFTFEAYYDNGWHYFDTNLEPDTEILREYKRPSVDYLARHPDIAMEAYRNSKDAAMLTRLIESYKTGPVNKFPAPNAYLYQVVLKYIGYFAWIFILLVIVLRYKFQYKRKQAYKRENKHQKGFAYSALS